MKGLYAKVILYFYPCADSLTEQIDEIVERRAVYSMRDFSPCEEQCLKILTLTDRKLLILKLKGFVENLLKKFTKDELLLLDYKYFKQMPVEAYAAVDFSERKYFRRQKSLLKRFATYAENKGLTDEIFERDYLSMDFFRELKRREEKRCIAYDKKKKSFINDKYDNVVETKIKISDKKRLSA